MGPEDSRVDERKREDGGGQGQRFTGVDRSLLCAHYEPYIPRPNVIRVSLLPKSGQIQRPMDRFSRPAYARFVWPRPSRQR
jgi:hypothetical protein